MASNHEHYDFPVDEKGRCECCPRINAKEMQLEKDLILDNTPEGPWTLATFPWLPKADLHPSFLMGPKYNTQFIPVFPQLEKGSMRACFLSMLSFAATPVMHKALHSMDVKYILGKDVRSATQLMGHFLSVEESLGFDYFRFLHDSYWQFNLVRALKGPTKQQKERGKRYGETIMFYGTLNRISAHVYVIGEDLLCKRAEDFVLEPIILIRLPWKPLLFHQWLLAALAEVLMFEQVSLELRYWPLSPLVFSKAAKLLELVRDLKERIILGFAIMSAMVRLHPKRDSRQPANIMDQVLLPSLPVLELLISGKAHKMVDTFKKVCWAEPQTVGDVNCKVVSPASYSLRKKFEQSYFNSYWHVNSQGVREPELIQIFKFAEWTELLQELHSMKAPRPHCFDAHIWAGYSQVLKMRSQEKIDFTLEVIENHIIKANLLPGLKFAAVKEFMSTEAAVRDVSNFPRFDDLCYVADVLLVNYLVFNALGFGMSYNNLVDAEAPRPSALSQVFMLHLKTTERLYLVQLVVACSRIFKVPLHMPQMLNVGSLSLLDIEDDIDSARSAMKKRSRDELFSQFPRDWQKKVSLSEASPVFSDFIDAPGKPSPDKVVNAMIARLGRIVWNTSRENFEMSIPYRHWGVVQYILPCFVSAVQTELEHFVKKVSAPPDKITFMNTVLGVHEAIKSYEKFYYDWKNGSLPTQVCPNIDLKSNRDLAAWVAERIVVHQKVNDKLLALISVYTNLLKGSGHTTPDTIYDVLFPFNFSHKIYMEQVKTYSYFFPCFQNLMNTLSEFEANLVDVFSRTFNALGPEVKSEHRDLSELHFSNCILYELETIALVACKKFNHPTQLFDKLMTSRCSSYTGYVEVQRALFLETIFPLLPYKMVMNIKELQETADKHYKFLKHFRKQYKIAKFPYYMAALEQIGHPMVRNAVALYMNGNLMELDNLMNGFTREKLGPQCHQCHKRAATMIPCQRCLSQKYPDVNYYCSQACKDKRWIKEHFAEHLEFELSISEYVSTEFSEQ